MAEAVTHADVLILGQGLAGSTLAWRLAERGVSVIVIDRGGIDEAGRPSASRVAAGLITPVTGKRLTVGPDYVATWESARSFYRTVESSTGAALLCEQPAWRLFRDAAERTSFLSRLEQPGFARHARLAEHDELPPVVTAPWGGFVMPGAARLNVIGYLNATRDWLAGKGSYLRADVTLDSDVTVNAAGVRFDRLGVTARCLVECQGYAATLPPLSPVKGEVLLINAPALQVDRVLHAGVWIAPEGGGGYRVGSTTDHERIDSTPTEAGRRELSEKLLACGVTGFTVAEHLAAVRPATSKREPTYGFRRDQPRVGWFNGLGAKGSLWAPAYADRMAELVVGSLS
ncbi:bifunctional tRNA (mnm(5)s(2)U34)-methyltransferase/FAD-dependent cmnm(5)s(2)U34 oxidoreductase [Botrimarina colliarenosi]|uniref:Bifunctional tRNA (Mnm(5)s(2)U34)-methyltransferase/FAD-dependent cmnm(5)s(2)U34 oxidoreductase n=1 Tax=Botrimarina colliarenosi TaxID=2528001 RepID=A0A5C6A9F5_9BACT|nr:FAD-binding oxidoreductase [Botrimarina colliarenosi]TWT96614.1 bifunctional tRNA (mnm(5)s(2)U34)-methyltransferase/FAD-dependent cmnm(5)s(2)U34 oxidoreductase [Botrimarina colliarenosi]